MQPKPQVLFAVPTFSGYVAYEFAGAMTIAACLLTKHGIINSTLYLPGLQFVDVARNFLVTDFLQKHETKTHIFFIDDDVGGFPAEKVLEFVTRSEDVVAGIYPLRQDGPAQYPVMLEFSDGVLVEQNGLVKAKRIPMGFTCIRRKVIEKLAAAADTYLFAQKDDDVRTVFNIFQRGPLNGEYVGEDVMFSWLCTDFGIDLWVDPDVSFTHRGSKRWEGTFRNAVNSYFAGTNKVATAKAGR